MRLYRPAQFAIDLGVLTAAFGVAYLLRFEFVLDETLRRALVAQTPFIVLVYLAALLLAGAHHRSWRYTGIQDLPVFARTAFYGTVVILAVRLAPVDVLGPLRIPLSITVMTGMLVFGGTLGARVTRRGVHELLVRRKRSRVGVGPLTPAILVGAGATGALAARHLEEAGIKPVAFVDDDPLKRGSVIAGIRVLGSTRDLPRLVDELGAEEVVITVSAIAAAQKRRIVGICEQVPISVRETSGYYEVLQGDMSLTRLREVQPESLLGREPVSFEKTGSEWLAGRRVLVTGAGGSIGSELSRQIAGCDPATLVLLERSEHALFEIDHELQSKWPGTQIVPVLANVVDETRVRNVFHRYCPDLVLHAAAHKHVTLMELYPCEAAANNIQGTRGIGQIAADYAVANFVLVSTDKAVKPTCVMSASKRVAELVIQDLDQRYAPKYSAVRFGNVLGSAGSVIPIFEEQIRNGGPVTVTDPDMKRYFMSIPEAAQLVLQAGSIAEGGEIFVLDMGKPIRILDLAENMIRLSGFEPYEEIPIEITGRRRGEKLFEELGQEAEDLSLTRHPKIFIGKLSPCPSGQLAAALRRLVELAESGDGEAIRQYLTEFLPEAELKLGVQEQVSLG